MKITGTKIVLLILLLLSATRMNAQCEVQNKCFQAGEHLTYDLYFKYGIIYTKAGTSRLGVTNSTYEGKDAYKLTLTAKSSGAARKLYALDDTLTSYITKDISPLAYRKDAHEKSDYLTERATFKYTPQGIRARNINKKNNKLRYDTTHVVQSCIYDMVSILFYVRTLNFEPMKKGDKVAVHGLVGRKNANMDIIYQGIETVKGNDDREYYCLKLSLVINDDAFDNCEEAMKVYITNDLNRIPIRVDSKLKVGSTRIILRSYSGLRN